MPDTPDHGPDASDPAARGDGYSHELSGEISPRPAPIHATITRVNSGPIPTALEFAEYEAAVPGTGQWFLDQAALDAQHVRDMERAGLKVTKREITLKHVVRP